MVRLFCPESIPEVHQKDMSEKKCSELSGKGRNLCKPEGKTGLDTSWRADTLYKLLREIVLGVVSSMQFKGLLSKRMLEYR